MPKLKKPRSLRRLLLANHVRRAASCKGRRQLARRLSSSLLIIISLIHHLPLRTAASSRAGLYTIMYILK